MFFIQCETYANTNKIRLFFISITKFSVNKEKYQALLVDHQADGRGPPVVRGPQVENRWYSVPYIRVYTSKNLPY